MTRSRRDAYERDRVQPFAANKMARDTQFANKDAVTLPVLQSLDVLNPYDYFAVLMPSLWGPELFVLREFGVPMTNIFAIERDPQTHAMLREPSNEMSHLVGIQTTQQSADAVDAIEEIPFHRVDLVYLDFFGQPDYSHYLTLYRLFRRRLLRPRAVLLLTFGHRRGDTFACLLNRQLQTTNVTEAYVTSAIGAAEHPRPTSLSEHAYRSGQNSYTLTEIRF